MTDRLTILLTNIWLDHFAGSEVVVRDVALGLLRRGHRPVVYSPKLGGVADRIVAGGVTVIDDLRALAETPDIIHAHHPIPCGEALIRFPHVPTIDVCHGFESWLEAPVHFPQIGAYVAVDDACRDRLVHREGIAPDRVVTLYNAVDLRRIPPRPRPLNHRPERAISFPKTLPLPQIQAACERMGIAHDTTGIADRTTAHPENELVNFDLVFASARRALEGLCCGCAVIVVDDRGLAGLVTSENFDSLRSRNFGLRTLTESVTVDRCLREIGRYDAADAARVSERARREADLESLLDAFEKLYDEVLTGARRPLMDAHAHDLAVGRFLHDYLPRHPHDIRWPWLGERERLRGEVESLRATVADLSARLEKAERDRLDTQRSLDEATARLTEMNLAHAGMQRALEEAHVETQRALDAARADMQRALDEASTQLADLKLDRAQTQRALEQALAQALAQITVTSRSRLLKIGRLLRRMTGRPIPY